MVPLTAFIANNGPFKIAKKVKNKIFFTKSFFYFLWASKFFSWFISKIKIYPWLFRPFFKTVFQKTNEFLLSQKDCPVLVIYRKDLRRLVEWIKRMAKKKWADIDWKGFWVLDHPKMAQKRLVWILNFFLLCGLFWEEFF